MRTFSVDSNCLYTDYNVQSKYSKYFNKSHLISFQRSKSKSSLTTSFLAWLLLVLFYATPLGSFCLSCVFIIYLIWFPFMYFKTMGIFGCLLILFAATGCIYGFAAYMVWYSWTYPNVRYDFVYSWIIPWFLTVLFGDAVIFAFQLKTRWRKLVKHVHTNWDYFGVFRKCQYSLLKQYVPYIPFLDDHDAPYKWGVTLHDYVPFGNITIHHPTSKTISMDDYLSADCMVKYDVSKKWTVCMGFNTFNKKEQIMTVMMAFLTFCYTFIPWIWHTIINSNDSNCKNICWFGNIIGLIENGAVSYCIFCYTELIYFQLFKYHAFMDQLADLLEINPIKKKNRMSPKQQRKPIIMQSILVEDQNIDEKEEKYDGSSIKIEMDLLKKGSSTPLLHCDDVNRHKNMNDDNWSMTVNDDDADCKEYIRTSRIYLYENENCQIWFENWCRIQSIAIIYFENRKYHFFAIIICITFGMAFIVIRILFSHTWFSPNIIAIYIGLLYFVMAFIRLLLSAVRFSDLQRKHIELLQNQHTFSLYKLKDKYLKYVGSDSKSFKKYLHNEVIYKMNVQFIMDIIKQIEFRSLSPKIAGVSLDSALLKVALSVLVFLLSSAITYELRQS